MATRSLQRWQKFLIALAAVGIIVALVLPPLLDINRYRDKVEQLVAWALRAEVSVSHIEWGLDQGLWLKLRDVSITDSTLLPAELKTPHAYARMPLLPLLKREVRIEQVIVEQPTLLYRLEKNKKPKKKPSDPDKPFTMPVTIYLDELQVEQGSLVVEDALSKPGRRLRHQFDTLDFTMLDLSPDKPLRFQADARTPGSGALAPGRLRVEGSFAGLNRNFRLVKPLLSLQLATDGLVMDYYENYLDSADLKSALSGTLSGKISFESNLRTQGKVDTTLDLSKFEYRNEALWPAPVPGAPLQIHAKARLQSGKLQVDTLQILSNKLAMSAAGSLDKQHQIPMLNNSVVSANLPLRDLLPFVPWPLLGQAAAPIRELLEAGGLVQVDQFRLPEIALGGELDHQALLESISVSARLSGLSVPTGQELPKLSELGGDLQLRGGVLTGDHFVGRFGALELPGLQFQASELLNKPRLEAQLKGALGLVSRRGQSQPLLAETGLRKLRVKGSVDIRASYDHARPDDWRAKGNLLLRDLELETAERPGSLAGHGKIYLRRKGGSLDLLLKGCEGRINGSRFKLNGAMHAVDTSDRLLDLHLQLERLDLAALTPWLNAAVPFEPSGHLSTDVNFYFLQADPTRTRGRGQIQLEQAGLLVPGPELRIERVDALLQLAPDDFRLKHLALQLNEQPLEMKGSLARLSRPLVSLQIKSPGLDLDQLLPPAKPDKSPQEPGAADNKTKTDAATLPSVAKQTTVKLDLDIAQGRFRGESFENLALSGRYKEGDLEKFKLGLAVTEGQIHARGSADLRDLAAVPFKLNYKIYDIDLRRFSQLLGTDDKFSATGKIASVGQLSGNSADLAGGLRGRIDFDAGPGNIPNDNEFARNVFNFLTFVNLAGIVKGELSDNLTSEGMPYNQLILRSRFVGGGVQMDQGELDTPAFNVRSTGELDFTRQQLDLDAIITVLGSLDKALGLVPLVGQSIADLTRVYLKIDGPLNKPAVRVQPGTGLATSITSALESPLRLIDPEAPGLK